MSGYKQLWMDLNLEVTGSMHYPADEKQVDSMSDVIRTAQEVGVQLSIVDLVKWNINNVMALGEMGEYAMDIEKPLVY